MRTKTNIFDFYVRMNEFEIMKVYNGFLQILFNDFRKLVYLRA